MEHIVVIGLFIVGQAIAAIIWNVRLEGRMRFVESQAAKNEQYISELRLRHEADVNDLRGRHEAMDSRILQDLTNLKVSVARIEAILNKTTQFEVKHHE